MRPEQPDQVAAERALAGAVRAEQGDALAGANREVDAGEHGLLRAVAEAHPAQLDDRRARSAPRAGRRRWGRFRRRGDDAAIVQVHDLLGLRIAHGAQAMFDDDDGRPGVGQAAQERHDAASGVRVERGERFVEQECGRLHGEDAGEGDALLFAAAEGDGAAAEQAADAELIGGGVHAAQDFVARQAEIFWAERDFTEHVGGDELFFRVLQHRADALAERSERKGCGVGAVDFDAAGERAAGVAARDEAVDAAREGGFAGAAGAGEQGEFAAAKVHVDVVERRAGAAGVGVGEVEGADHRRSHAARGRAAASASSGRSRREKRRSRSQVRR